MLNKMTPEYIDDLIASESYHQVGTLTVCALALTNGCQVVGTSNVIDPVNYDAKLGEDVAFQNARDKIWELEGYALKRALALAAAAV